MGITVTSNLALIKPDANESIKQSLPTFNGWASQNGTNMDKIDALFRKDTASYTPVWSAVTTPPTLGAGGLIEGKYVRFLPRLVVVFVRIFCGGAGFAAGTGNYSITIPVAADPSFSAFSHTLPIGKMIYQDNSAVLTSSVFPLIYSPSAGTVFARPSEGGTWGSALPVVPAQNDRYSGYFIYPTAVP
jgi:hypothetical protein